MILLPTEQAIYIPVNVNKDMSDEEFELEMDYMFERSRLAKLVLENGVGFEDYCDLLQSQNINVDSYLDAVEECLSIF
jgi:hypothetical protein